MPDVADVTDDYARQCAVCFGDGNNSDLGIPSYSDNVSDNPLDAFEFHIGTPFPTQPPSTFSPATNTPTATFTASAIPPTFTPSPTPSVQFINILYNNSGWSAGTIVYCTGAPQFGCTRFNQNSLTITLSQNYFVTEIGVRMATAPGSDTSIDVLIGDSPHLLQINAVANFYYHILPSIPQYTNQITFSSNVSTGVYVTDLYVFYATNGFFTPTFTPSPTFTPTLDSGLPTLQPTATHRTGLEYEDDFELDDEYDCSEPELNDVENNPVAVFGIEDTFVETSCYMIFPGFGWDETTVLGITIPEFGIDGLELCVNWYSLPPLEIFGIAISVDIFLIFPFMWVVRRLLQF